MSFSFHKFCYYKIQVFVSLFLILLLSTCKSPSFPLIEEKFELNSTGLPTIYLNISSGEHLKDTKNWVDANLSIVSADGESIFDEKINAKGRGNTSWQHEKQSFSLKLSKKNSMFGMKKHKRWVLIANHADKTLLRNDYASYLGNEIFDSEWNPSFISVNLIYNNEYWGTYLFGEQIKISSSRVDIQDISKIDEDINGDGEVNLDDGGFIVEINVRSDEDFNFQTKHGLTISLKDPDEVSLEIQERVKSIIQDTEDILFSDNFSDSENGYSKYIDVDSFIDWYFVNEFSKNVDAAKISSIYMYYNPMDQKIHMGPNWDFDLAFGNVNYAGCDSAEGGHIYPGNVEQSADGNGWDWNGWGWGWGWNFGQNGDSNFGWQSGGNLSGNVWICRLMEDSVFKEKMNKRWNEKKSDLYSSINSIIQAKADYIKASTDLNFTKWPKVLGYNIFYNASGYENRKTFQSEVDYLIDWCNSRYEWMDSLSFLEYSMN
ncbi:MAG: CotH kinase family protein [Treponema sp.]|nr:CotH kinase family protein [Treponema sp.]